MPLINTTEVVDRNNRPQVQSKVMLRTFFINDGVYQDPYAISSVQLFKRANNLSPSSVLNTDGLIASSNASTQTIMGFGVTGTGIVNGTDADSSFNESNYTGTLAPDTGAGSAPCSGVSGIYKLATGEFACVLDGVAGSSLSGNNWNGHSVTNTGSQATRYIDIWTIKLTQGSDWKTYINHFELFDDTFFAITEPLMLRTKNKLFNKQVILGSKENIKIGTEVTIENESVDESVKNIFRESVITSATVTIKKMNEDSYLPSRVTVVSSTEVQVTSDNTIIYSFDTATALSTGDLPGSETLNTEDLGSKNGTYALQVSYNILSEKIVSPLMYFIVK
jgi:hypothetical protein